MARRGHVTEVGSIACEELDELGAGAGAGEGWLSDSSVLVAFHRQALALARARRPLVLVLAWNSSRSRSPTKIRPSLSTDDGGITAVEWIPSGGVLAIGTSAGCLLLYSLHGVLIHRQFVYSGAVLRLRFRETRSGDGPQPDRASYELCLAFSGVIARFDGSDIQGLLQRWFQEEESHLWDDKFQKRERGDGESFGRLPFQLWNITKYGSCVDAAITGLLPPPLLEVQSSQHHYCAVAIGDDAVVSAYRISEDRSRSIVGTIISKVVPATFSTLASVSKLLWRSEQNSTKKSRPAHQPFAKAFAITCLKDHPRKGEKITLSPRGTLAAITDSLGRILLLDTQALVIVRLWKGYREACCLFIEMLISRDKAPSSMLSSRTKGDFCLCLAIYAPRKEIIEIWKMRTGPRLLTIPCPKGSKILQPSTIFRSASSSSYVPLEVFILNGDSGQLSVINGSIG